MNINFNFQFLLGYAHIAFALLLVVILPTFSEKLVQSRVYWLIVRISMLLAWITFWFFRPELIHKELTGMIYIILMIPSMLASIGLAPKKYSSIIQLMGISSIFLVVAYQFMSPIGNITKIFVLYFGTEILVTTFQLLREARKKRD